MSDFDFVFVDNFSIWNVINRKPGVSIIFYEVNDVLPYCNKFLFHNLGDLPVNFLQNFLNSFYLPLILYYTVYYVNFLINTIYFIIVLT